MPKLKIDVIILEDRFHSKLEVAFIQFSNPVRISMRNVGQKNVLKPARYN
jgi:hypothetical protein